MSAGLPNINGSVSNILNFVNGTPTKNGAFSSTSYTAAQPYDGNVDQPNMGRIALNFSARNSNTIYGNSSTVQPPALQLVPQIRY